MSDIKEIMPEMLTGEKLMERLGEYPFYSSEMRRKDSTERLMSLSDIYDIYIPSQMSVEIYHKLYMGIFRSLQKKESVSSMRMEKASGEEGTRESWAVLIPLQL